LLEHLLPMEIGKSPETLRGHTLKIGEQLRDTATAKPPVGASTITVTPDSTFIRGCRDGERHLEVRVGDVETSSGGRQVFGAVAKADTEIAVLIRRSLETVSRAADTELTAFTDGCSGLQSVLAEAGCQKPPIADLVPHRHAAAACEAGSERIVDRHARSDAGEGSDRRGSRTPAL
jgi:hypothetical protein